MRKVLVGLPMLLVVAGLCAQDASTPRPQDKPARTFDRDREWREPITEPAAERRDAWGDAEARTRRAQGTEERISTLQLRKNQMAAEHKMVLATIDAEYKVKVATLDRELLTASAELEQLHAEFQRANREQHRQQERQQRDPRSPAAPTDRPGAEPPRGPAGGPGSALADQKLDAIMQKLEEMDARLRRLERAPRAGPQR
jgi:DNA repair exonuclease SbcCD ATPase subunit